MSEIPEESGLKVVDAFDLDDELRSILRPGEMIRDKNGRRHRLPRYFYEVESKEEALDVDLAPNFRLSELLLVDIKESPRLQAWPRFVPCVTRLLASYLQRMRDAAGMSVHVAVNGGYRSPAHQLAHLGTPHMWGTAADIYRVGTTILQDESSIERFRKIFSEISDELWVMPYGHEPGTSDDHIHVDLGYILLIPREMSEDRMEVQQQQPRFAFEERRRGDRRRGRSEPDRRETDPGESDPGETDEPVVGDEAGAD
ncbi:MAG: hypothetical protein WBX15_17280 [Thermoanaerobaculia bacterium]